MPAKTKGKHNLRQRKKLRLGEFQELGFEVSANSTKELSQEERAKFIDDLIISVDGMGLLFAGGLNSKLAGFVVVNALRGSVTEEQREAFGKWLASRPELADVQVGPLKDAWYST